MLGARNSLVCFTASVLSLFACPVFAQSLEAETTYANSDFLDRIRVSLDLRARYQTITREADLDDGQALTLRGFGTVEMDLGNRVSLLGEIEATGALIGRYNDGTDVQSSRPFIPDPEGFGLNRLTFVSETIPNTRASLGRQRIALDDWRFLGSFPFRQNDQTIDGLRIERRELDFGNKTGVLDIGLFNQVNRPLGPDNLNGTFEGPSWYANYGLTTKIGRLGAFHYDFLLKTDVSDASSRTTGVRLLGRRHSPSFGVVWEASYARQSDKGDNPREYDTDYWLGRLRLEPGDWAFVIRGEELGSDDGHSLQTPLASLHRFSGLADQFLQTPPAGLRDVSLSVERNFGRVGPFDRVRVVVAAHRFEDAGGDIAYGDEVDLSLSARVGDALIAIEHARYTADQFSTNTQSTVLSVSYAFRD